MDMFLKILFVMIFCIINYYFIRKSVKKQEQVDFFNVDVIDNKAQWVYNNKLYYADMKDGKVDYSTKKEIVL